MRLIDGDALKEAFYQKMKELLKSTTTPQISNEVLSLLCGASLIAEAPTIEPPAEKTGKWLMTDGYPHKVYCSECYATLIPNVEWFKTYNIASNYCPNCGARMVNESE